MSVYTLRSFGFNARGVEPDMHYGKYSIEKLLLPVKIAFFQDVEFTDKFNLITMHHVLEHTENPLGILKKIQSLLAPGGFLYIGVPNAEDISQAPRNRYHKAHLYTFNPETIAEMCRKAGFAVCRIDIKPYNGDIAIILQKNGKSETVTGEIPGNCRKITAILGKNNALRHFASSFPYRKFVINITRPFKEKAALKKYTDECAMLNAIIKKTLARL